MTIESIPPPPRSVSLSTPRPLLDFTCCNGESRGCNPLSLDGDAG